MNAKYLLLGIGGLGAIVALAFILWQSTSVDYEAKGVSQRTFFLNVDYDKFRRIMVRKNATQAIVGHSGMRLLENHLSSAELDTSNDNRPVLNAILGKSQSDLSATKQIVVSLNDPELDADRLMLTQHADIQPDAMRVRTVADGPAGKLKDYQTTLEAKPEGNRTEVKLNVELQIQTRVPKLFAARADRRVQTAAVNASKEQQAAITEFIDQHADEVLVLPEF